jgi:hypothetical protein
VWKTHWKKFTHQGHVLSANRRATGQGTAPPPLKVEGLDPLIVPPPEPIFYQEPFMINALKKSGIKGSPLHIVKAVYDKPILTLE